MTKRLIYFFGHGFFLVLGYFFFILTGRNTERAYQALIYFFCRTGGRVNAWLARLDGIRAAPLVDLNDVGVLGSVADMRTTGVQQVREHGYLVKNAALPEQTCDRLMAFALATPAVVRPMDGEAKSGVERLERVNLENPSAVRYDYKVADLLANPDFQSLLADSSLLALAESYLGAAPKLDVLSMWWHTGFHDRPDSEAAQMYHFDLDRPRWLKIFIYLTDVGLQNGPHSFIKGSHCIGAIPDKFLQRGYVRLNDAEVLNEYGAEREIVFTAPRGTIIAEDTIGLHKGGVVTGGARLLLQLQFSSSLFGARYPKSTLPSVRVPTLQRMIAANPAVYRGYL